MACSKCKKKQQEDYVRKELEKSNKLALLVLLGIGLLSLYGIYTLISNIL
jgi:hypothetical protein